MPAMSRKRTLGRAQIRSIRNIDIDLLDQERGDDHELGDEDYQAGGSGFEDAHGFGPLLVAWWVRLLSLAARYWISAVGRTPKS